VRAELRGAGGVVVGSGVERRLLVLPDVDEKRNAVEGGDPLRHRVRAVVVEAHAIDERALFGITEKPRSRIARLRPRRHRADLDEAEAERGEERHHQRVLVEAGGDADRRRKRQAEELRRARWRAAERFDHAQRQRDPL